MVTGSPPRSRRPQVGAGRRGFQRPHGPPGGASLALGPPAAGRRFSLHGSLGPASLYSSQTRPRASRSSFAFVRDGFVPRRDRGPFTGWRTDAQVAQGARVETFREAHRQPPTPSRLHPLRESWVCIFRCLEMLRTSWYQEAGETHFCLVGRNSAPRRAVDNVFI